MYFYVLKEEPIDIDIELLLEAISPKSLLEFASVREPHKSAHVNLCLRCR